MKKWICTVLSLLVVFSMTACQPTPEKPVVGNKDTNKLIDKATGGTSTAETGLAAKVKEAKDTGKKLSEVLGTPKTLTKTLTSKSSKITVNMNATIDVPDLSALPTIRVAKKSISQSDIDKLSSLLLGGASLYNATTETKAEIQDEILRLKERLAKASKSDKAIVQQTLDKYEQLYKNAPESNKLAKIPLSFTKQNGADLIEGITDHSDGKYKYFQAVNMSSTDFFQVFYTCETSQYCLNVGLEGFYFPKNTSTSATAMKRLGIDINQINKLPTLQTTKEQAQAMADNVVNSLGLSNFTCTLNQAVDGFSGLRNGTTFLRHAYELQYVRTINGAAMTYANYPTDCNDYQSAAKNAEQKVYGNASFAPSWAPESITFLIDDTGIVNFRWRSPCEIKNTITKNTALLPFSDISAVFDQMVYVKYADSRSFEKQDKSTLNITKVKLGLMRVLEQNKDTGLIIPVWDFFGSQTWEGQSYKNDDPSHSFLTINAIDGSIINREAGY